ncbi:magnesium transporter [Pseudoalteromonas sp. GCY]|uniref:magnesium transporter n=1 Tax=Pseudoalteromonas sp. GCY TaxID=2003316 RepID=UPI000BFF1641|nr:magnesium transporter [Pseudoalteromonas sp. GCY]PHI35647.1 magnesium transporter [Pseudoalteromonas sp. GCY]QQQ64566.1 magnesium transporter [Pseudoalteromonas sp. GCY]
MSVAKDTLDSAVEQLSDEFLSKFPLKSAQLLGTLPPDEAAELLRQQAQHIIYRLWKYLPPGAAEQIFLQFPVDYQAPFIASLDSHIAVGLLNKQSQEAQQALLAKLKEQYSTIADELSELLIFPENTAARMMNKKVQAFYGDTTLREVLAQLKRLDGKVPDVIYVLNEQQDLVGETTLNVLVGSSSSKTLMQVATPIRVTLNVMDHKDQVVEAFEGHKVRAIPVLDAQQQLVGQIRFFDAYQSTKEDLASDMQTMVGASKDEKALSSSWFAVKKRLPWLQINLLTAFAAAAVVGAFEGLIAQVTALAILLPVAAGQSGNAGAQALAVTMRGLTLREISTRHWYQVMLKEMMVGLLNGIAIAVTCGIGVYLWSQSLGLALVIALAMISSLVIAGSSGAIVPIALKKFGLDPAQSSSIVLTTITDIAGFMSFLGIALLLSDMLPKG